LGEGKAERKRTLAIGNKVGRKNHLSKDHGNLERTAIKTYRGGLLPFIGRGQHIKNASGRSTENSTWVGSFHTERFTGSGGTGREENSALRNISFFLKMPPSARAFSKHR